MAAATYMDMLGSAADTALAMPEIWNTPETSVPGAYSTMAMQKAIARMLNKMGASVPQDGNKNGAAFNSALTMRFGADYAKNYRWAEIVQQLYADIQAGRMLKPRSMGILDMIPGPSVSGIPVVPIVVGLGLLWYFSKSKSHR